MPQQADITVKKNDGTTDIVYTKMSPAGGDGVPAIWRSNSVGNSAATRPEVRVHSKNGTYKGQETRSSTKTMVFPWTYVDSTTGLTKVGGHAFFKGVWEVPKGMPQTDVNEFASQTANIVDHAQVVDTVKDGFAPN